MPRKVIWPDARETGHNTNLYDTEVKVDQQYGDKAWQQVAHIGRYWDNTMAKS